MNKDAKTLILDFNHDPESRKLQSFYRRKAMMEIMGKARDEESHSAFLAWLFEGRDLTASQSDSPLMWMLQILVSREDTVRAPKEPIPNEIKAQILNRSLQFTIDEVKREVVINNEKTHNYFKYNFPYNKDEKDGQDRLDIYIKCSLTKPNKCEGYKTFEIFIENKILSPEGGAKLNKDKFFVPEVSYNGIEKHDDLPQTERYYKALSHYNDSSNLQFFVYLVPGVHAPCASKHYYQVTYQDILDRILISMIQNEDLSERSKFLIQDYIDGLSIPTLDEKERKRIVMATTKKEVERINAFMKHNELLLYNMLVAMVKKCRNKILSKDEELLIEFAKSNKNLIYAAYNICNNEWKVNLDALYEGSLPIGKNYYLIEPIFGIFNDSTFGFEFAKSFAWYCYNRSGLIKPRDLNTELSRDVGSRITVFSVKKGGHHEEIPNFPSKLFAVKANWKPSGNLGKITRKTWPCISFIVI